MCQSTGEPQRDVPASILGRDRRVPLVQRVVQRQLLLVQPRGDVFDNKLCNDRLTFCKFLTERRVNSFVEGVTTKSVCSLTAHYQTRN